MQPEYIEFDRALLRRSREEEGAKKKKKELSDVCKNCRKTADALAGDLGLQQGGKMSGEESSLAV